MVSSAGRTDERSGTKSQDEARFRIEATGGLREPRTRILKNGETFAVLNQFGDMVPEPGSPDGLYHRDTRHLSRLELRINGDRPLLLSSNPVATEPVLPVDLANTDTVGTDGAPLQRELIYVNRRQLVWQSSYVELLLIHNFDQKPHVIRIDIGFGADFVDIFEVRGQSRPRHGRRSAVPPTTNSVTLRYAGLDHVERATTLSFSPAPTRLDERGATFHVPLAAGEWSRLSFRVSCEPGANREWSVRDFYRAVRDQRHAFRAATGRAPVIRSSNAIFDELQRRSLCDVYVLCSDTEFGPFPYAGIPWYSTPFGRDGIITALMMLWLDPEIARGVLRFLAATQATETDEARDAAPGKILHEMRNGEMAQLGEVPFGRYYGTVDATPLFVMLAGEYFARTGDLATIRQIWPNILAALRWIDADGDIDGDGFVEYRSRTASGLVNQGWKDSADAIFHADGALAEGPIALCEVQGYVFAAKRHAAALARVIGDAAMAERLEHEAEDLRTKFEAAFWCDDLETYALALDGRKRQCRVVASNAGHALLTGIAAPDRAAAVARSLTGVNCFSGWGIRTVGRDAARFNPISYHNGSVWPHDNALIALGFARYGMKDAAVEVFRGLFDAASHLNPRQLPELFCGFARRRSAPIQYPVACAPQAWASAAVFALLQASLGLGFDHENGEIRFEGPVLPSFLDQVQLHGLRLGGAEADVTLHRLGDEVAATVTERRGGDLRVVVTH